MVARAFSAGILGVEGFVVTVEAEVGLGIPGLVLVGRASGAVQECRQRVKAALGHCGHPVPARKETVNLAPADKRKDSSGIDLAVAVALLAAHGIVEADRSAGFLFWAELSLDGALRPAAGTLVVADTARQAGFHTVVVAPGSDRVATWIPNIEVLVADSLRDLVAHLRGEHRIEAARRDRPALAPDTGMPDMSDVRGLTVARLAVEVMVAGGHNLLLHGPPGVGKTMLARRAAGLFPRLSRDQAVEVTKIHTVAHLRQDGLIERAPVRMPHHSVSPAGLLGGGNPPRPGEVSMSHRGLLFLDELPEFPRSCIEGLREPLEDGEVGIVRASYAVRFPARFQLMAAMNPCPCGYLGHPERACVDGPAAIARYQQRISGPFMDRMDLVVPVHPITGKELASSTPSESSAVIRDRITIARERQARRLRGTPWTNNAEVPATGRAIERLMPLTEDAAELLEKVGTARSLSPRARHRLRRVARTIADLDPEADETRAEIGMKAVARAAHLRRPPDPGVA